MTYLKKETRFFSTVQYFLLILFSNKLISCKPLFLTNLRGGRSHRGIDIVCSAGNTVYAPFPGKIIRNVRPYGNGKPHDIGVLIHGTGTWQGIHTLI